MLNIKQIRKDFPILKTNMQGNPLIYFDSAATSLKPKCVIEAISNYYLTLGSNAHRADYDLSFYTSEAIEQTRNSVAQLINADLNEIIFTSGTTDSLNFISSIIAQDFKKGDEVVLSFHEHAANTLPWFSLIEKCGIKVRYIPLNKNGTISLANLKKVINQRTKVVSLALVSNVLGISINAKEIGKYLSQNKILFIIDAAQAILHRRVDVKELNCDFLAFSAHKMVGPTGVGILYGKEDLLNHYQPYRYGGSMNESYNQNGSMTFYEIPTKFESGTPNISNIIAFKSAIDYLNNLGLDEIHEYIVKLKRYAIHKLKQNQQVILYNANIKNGTIVFNVKNVFAQDVASYLNSKGIAVRSGEHCAKLLHNFLNVTTTVRVSLSFYNTKKEIDFLCDCLATGGDFLDGFFK